MKHLFIINPAAESWDRTKEYTQAIRSACEARGLDYRIEVSQAPGHCETLAREAPKPGRNTGSTPAAGMAP